MITKSKFQIVFYRLILALLLGLSVAADLKELLL
tara:strand:- start:281 stop:382 length:102 start_codon:yes stop_codon:yes gene_type:complete